MYERRSRLNARQQAELIKFFVAGATARAAGEIAGVNRNTAASYFMRLRRLIAMHLPSYRLSGEVEADESYFDGVRKGKRGRGAAGKIRAVHRDMAAGEGGTRVALSAASAALPAPPVTGPLRTWRQRRGGRLSSAAAASHGRGTVPASAGAAFRACLMPGYRASASGAAM